MIVYDIGDKIYWKWMGCKIFGVIVNIYHYPIVKEIKGKKIKRNGSLKRPAYYVRSEAGNYALKIYTEIQPADGIQDEL